VVSGVAADRGLLWEGASFQIMSTQQAVEHAEGFRHETAVMVISQNLFVYANLLAVTTHWPRA
jgi:hypothetical protein